MKKENFTGFFLLAILMLGVGFTLLAVPSAWVSIRHDPFSDLIQGETAHDFEKGYDKALPHYNSSIRLWDRFDFMLFGEGRRGVLIGDDGWLFSDEEFHEGNNFSSTIASHVGEIKDVQQRLASQNIKLLVVPIPAKARLYQEKLGRYHYPVYWRPVYSAFLKALQDSDIAYVDLLAAFERRKTDRDLFLRTDTHWSPDGARLAAELVAETLSKTYPYLSFKRQKFSLQPSEPEEYEGDLMRYVAKGEGGVRPDSIRSFTLSGPAIETLDQESLFGTKDIPVVLVGTSYSAHPQWGFEYSLKSALQADILNWADEGEGPFAVMQVYLESDVFADTPPRLVIWEIPERYLPVPLDEDKT